MTFGLNASPFILTVTIRNFLNKLVDKEKETVDTLKSSLYVNDLCSGDFDDEGTLTSYNKAMEIMSMDVSI